MLGLERSSKSALFVAGLLVGFMASTMVLMSMNVGSNMSPASSGARVFANLQNMRMEMGNVSVAEVSGEDLASQMYAQLSAKVLAPGQGQSSSPSTLGQATADSINSFLPGGQASGAPKQQTQPGPAAAPQVIAQPAPAATDLKRQAQQATLGDVTAQQVKAMLPPPATVAESQSSLGSQLVNFLQPISTFNPAPARKATKATNKDCDHNHPHQWNASFMVQPPMPPGDPCSVIVNLMTTFVDNADPSKKVAQENTLRAFQRLRPFGVRAWLFTENVEWARKARENGVEVVARFRKNNANTPCLTYMYEYIAHNDGCSASTSRVVFDGYVNGDILLGKDLADTMKQVAQVWGQDIKAKTRGVLVIGFRFNQNIGTKEIKSEAELVEFGKTAKAFQANAEDYFLFSRGAVDWQAEIAQFVVGRPAYDNWLVDHAVHEKKVDVIDATKTIRAIHQTCKDGVFAGHAPRLDSGFNKNAINPRTNKKVSNKEWDHGTTNHAHFSSEIKDGQVVFKARGKPPGGARTLPASAPPVVAK
eukprot:CAMPEP_0177706252 /NCGR_PEP_ID=MMETSP0484_2-20121128/9127_1 /TAXON_ID=354590 /ORGANISM="Rhodomonas lens, Strain RHODO" /LENGTH=532 /DNA_ID=CAMNT_0019217703 /DNA_START=144 /DNA_END=1742 /DNA_ORIENTATION=+